MSPWERPCAGREGALSTPATVPSHRASTHGPCWGEVWCCVHTPLISMETVIRLGVCHVRHRAGHWEIITGPPTPAVAKSSRPRSLLSGTQSCGAF